jgi:Type II secretion system (T2SS), protein E, N-terminal domain
MRRPARLDHKFFEDEVRPHLGALMVDRRFITAEQLDQALEEKKEGELLGEALVRLGFAFEDDIAKVLAKQERLDFVDINTLSVDPHAAIRISPELGAELRAIPVRFEDDGMLVAVADPFVPKLVERLDFASGARIKLGISTPSAIENAWRQIKRLTRF